MEEDEKMNLKNIVIAIDGTSASGKSTNSKLVARALGYVYVDTGAMYRTLAWHCLQKKADVDDAKAVAALCRKWKTSLECVETKNGLRAVHLLVDGYFPEKEIRTPETAAAVPHVAAIPKVREWMVKRQRECIAIRQSCDGRPRHRHECFPGNGFQILPGRDAGRAFRTPRR